MKRIVYLVFLIATLSCVSAAQDAVESFWELALSDDFAVIEKHLPGDFVQVMADCDPNYRERIVRDTTFVPSKRSTGEARIDISRKSEGVVTFHDSHGQTLELRIASSYVTADSAMLGLVLTERRQLPQGAVENPSSLVITMYFEEGSWRLANVALPGPVGAKTHIFDKNVGSSCRLENEESAAGSLRVINTAQVTYSATYPENGFASTLSTLGPPATSLHPFQEAAGMIDGILGCAAQPCIKDGYQFRIETPATKPRTAYKAYGRPATYGKTGVRSFYSDDSGVLHFTTEDRDANSQDPKL